ncbi:MAG: hypothetical protein Barrevirus18_15 [Barrevirus sp.]|uniref:Uncharacterized protein n=1 Tax=Barrevirus sp. TaxID=2487763 RepID=A0A3G4ZT65_9VIRU|nr:MAG: hypothetical protein Barrevirus18_15 [Barrevirus sp.]
MEIIDDRILVFRNAFTDLEQQKLNKEFNNVLTKTKPMKDGISYEQHYLGEQNVINSHLVLQKYKDILTCIDEPFYNFNFDAAYLIAYKNSYVNNIKKFKGNELMRYHYDRWSNYNLTVSIGHSARFMYIGSRNVERVLEIHSGDMVIFNGFNILHTVKTIQKRRDKCPKWFTSLNKKDVYRFNLQFRKRNVEPVRVSNVIQSSANPLLNRSVSSTIEKRKRLHNMKLRNVMKKR